MQEVFDQLFEYIDSKQSFYYVFESGKRVNAVFNYARNYWHWPFNPRNGFSDVMIKFVVESAIKEAASTVVGYGIIPDQITDLNIAEFKTIALLPTGDNFPSDAPRGLYVTRDLSQGTDCWVAMSTLTGVVIAEEFPNRLKAFDFLLKEAVNAHCKD